MRVSVITLSTHHDIGGSGQSNKKNKKEIKD